MEALDEPDTIATSLPSPDLLTPTLIPIDPALLPDDDPEAADRRDFKAAATWHMRHHLQSVADGEERAGARPLQRST